MILLKIKFAGHHPQRQIRKLPARFDDTRNVAAQRELAEAEAAHFKLSQVTPWASTDAATVAVPNLELRLS